MPGGQPGGGGMGTHGIDSYIIVSCNAETKYCQQTVKMSRAIPSGGTGGQLSPQDPTEYNALISVLSAPQK